MLEDSINRNIKRHHEEFVQHPGSFKQKILAGLAASGMAEKVRRTKLRKQS